MARRSLLPYSRLHLPTTALLSDMRLDKMLSPISLLLLTFNLSNLHLFALCKKERGLAEAPIAPASLLRAL